ncbi:hypothetical protein GUJ93_ZPchr0006g41141 [Zizania palustris]|uniref:Uncharacterized protein n=1 Tax=Zizania palustris TaxID=103762 RepID=A0A8J5VKJ7_ZIZPA|nr:hypothetical protein GUJ93_ZPchr0006g41141 [Zizania palustris]
MPTDFVRWGSRFRDTLASTASATHAEFRRARKGEAVVWLLASPPREHASAAAFLPAPQLFTPKSNGDGGDGGKRGAAYVLPSSSSTSAPDSRKCL